MYTIKRVAELTGIGLSTLRAWERRYGVVTPQRSEGQYRLYTDADVRTIAIMASLVSDGWSASAAAAETLQRVSGGVERFRAEGSGPGSATTEGLAELICAGDELDAPRVAAILRSGLDPARGSFESLASSWLLPALVGIGEAWADGRLSVAGEHLVSYSVQRHLAGAYEAASGRATGSAVVLGLPPGSRHELGLLAFAVAARRAGMATAYVGADLPAEEWESAVRKRGAQAVVMAVPRLTDVVVAQEVVDRLRAAFPELVIAMGGRYQDHVEHVTELGHDLAASVALLESELARARRAPARRALRGTSMERDQHQG